MSFANLIPVKEFCERHEVEFSFLNSLHESGLIEIISIRQMNFLHSDDLAKLEQIVLFNQELQINLEGVEVIINLLERVRNIQNEVIALKNKLQLYED